LIFEFFNNVLFAALSPALSLFCVGQVARRLDCDPYWSQLVPHPQETAQSALSLSPALCALVLPFLLAVNEEAGTRLAAQLLAQQLHFQLYAEAADTLRFALQSAVHHPTVTSHIRSLRLNHRLLSCLLLGQQLEALSHCTAVYCESHADAPLSFWPLASLLSSQLGLSAPRLQGTRLVLPMPQETRLLLQQLLTADIAPPLRTVGALLLLRVDLLRTDVARLAQPPEAWLPLIELLQLDEK
jgi:hypothetical protein